MSRRRRVLGFVSVMVCWTLAGAQETHEHGAPEKLGQVSFAISCKPAVQAGFNRGVALLHSFAYRAAQEAFHGVADRDPQCAMAHWGLAMSYFRQLWEPAILPDSDLRALQEVEQGIKIGRGSEREQKFLEAARLVFQDEASVPYRMRAAKYEQAMKALASANKNDVEVQVLYALALLANASPADKTHARQKEAAAILEPLDLAYPDHPGIPHYLIHAYDNAELASRGLPAARAYSKVAPSAPHALHMPSHIFTRLGLWEDSIASNIAAREAARQQDDIGEELHSMDYLVYTYLQSGQESAADEIVRQLKAMPKLNTADFKIGYASTAMPIRSIVERKQWADAASIVPPEAAPPHVIAIAFWARGLGLARGGHASASRKPIEDLQGLEEKLRRVGNDYWARQVGVMMREVMAWSAQAEDKKEQAVALMREAADEEDSIEKLPVTPGPIVPAREQLGELLLEQGNADLALTEFRAVLVSSPGRRGAIRGAAHAAEVLRRK